MKIVCTGTLKNVSSSNQILINPYNIKRKNKNI